MSDPQISIVIPVYNTSEYLVQCLDTIVNQTFRDIEIICVNDGSTDGSFDILKEFSDKDNRLILINRNVASGSAALPRNMGLDLAQGKYVMFLDSDDYFDLTMLEKLYTYAEKTKSDLVMCDNYAVSFTTGEIKTKDTELHYEYLPKNEVFSYKDIPDTIFQISNAACWHKLILRETLIHYNLKFQLDTPILDDIYFVNLLLVLSKRISVIRDRLVFYRTNRYDAQTTKIEKHKESIFLAFMELNQYLAAHSLYEEVKVSLQNWTLATMAWWLYSIGNYKVHFELLDLYKKEYFNKLGLMDIVPGTLYDGPERFYNNVLECDIERSLKVVLESTLVPGSKIAIYGAGLFGHHIYELVKTHDKHHIVIWCDKNADKIGNSLIKHPSKMTDCDFDAIIIAIADYGVIKEVKEYLLGMGVEVQKIYTI